MNTAGTRVQPVQATFRDGLGIRHLRNGAGGPLEVLTLHQHLTTVPDFESLLRERIARLAQFRQPHYAHARDLEIGDEVSPKLALVSDHVPGVRLSRMLALAEQNLLPLDVDSALCLIRKLVTAVAVLHETGPDAWHGALAAERIVIAPDARLVVVEHVLGSALEQLQYSRQRFWTDLRVALPREEGDLRLNRRTDVVQVGMIALALLLGRPIGEDEFPSGVNELATGTFGLGGEFEPIPQWLQTWLAGTLWLDPTQGFASAVEARHALDSGLETDRYSASHASLEKFIAQYDASVGGLAPAAAAEVVVPVPTAPGPPPVLPKATAPTPAAPAVNPVILRAVNIVTPSPHPRDEEVDVPQTHMGNTASGGHSQRPRRIAAAIVLVALTSGGVMAARRYLSTSPEPGPAMGTLAVQTNPAGAAIVIDGRQRGVTPLSVSVNAGPHTLELSADGVHRTIPVTVAANANLSQFIEMPKAAPLVGQLDVRTDPSGAKVSVDGQVRGVSPLTVTGLAAGRHMVVLENELGAVNEEVSIEPGTTAALVVPLRGPQGAPVSGWISIAAPAEVQVFENQRLLGSSRTDRIMVAAGRHDLEIINDALGYRTTQSIQVAPGQVAKIKPDWPQGTIAINAAPWANVWLDGQEVGETPVGNTRVPIGTHEVIFRHPQLGEQRYTTTVTATTPARLSVDMRKK